MLCPLTLLHFVSLPLPFFLHGPKDRAARKNGPGGGGHSDLSGKPTAAAAMSPGHPDLKGAGPVE